MPAETSILICISIVQLLAVCIILYFVIKKRNEKHTEYVRKTSLRYNALLSLNQAFHFNDIPNTSFPYRANLNSKAQFDRFNYHKFFLSIIDNERSSYETLSRVINLNRLLYAKYKEDCSKLPAFMDEGSLSDLKFSHKRYCKLEKSICSQNVLSPVLDITIACSASYTSPQGRSHYEGHENYNMQDIASAFQQLQQVEVRKETAAYQRFLMSSKLRYEILTRDNHRCRICGRGAQDGVTLHVDHIVPVSKGGKTIASNLRTLCSDCNLGKGDSYNPRGIN